MKIKGLLIGMLACTALVGCTDDDVLNGNELENQQAEQMRAYMTFSIASSTNSSRGVGEGSTNGDNDGNAEHSGHESDGTTEEQKVNSILICFYNEDEGSNDGFSYKFTMNNDGSSNDETTYNSYSTKLTKEGDGYKLTNPFAINSLGTYNVMVVINPSSKITTTNAQTRATAKAIYDDILNGKAISIEDIIGSNKDNFMMANRKKVTIKVEKEHNDPTNPAGKSDEAIEVERVASKITFRSTEYTGTNTLPTNLGSSNVYQIEQTEYKYEITQSNFWFKDTDGVYRYLTNLFKAEDLNDNEYWEHITKDDQGNVTARQLYKQIECPQEDDIKGESADDNQYEGNLSNGQSERAYVVDKVDTNPDTYVYVGTKIETGTKTPYYVKLQKYTLANLNNSVFYVRHTSEDMVAGQAWGFVNSSNTYIFEPNSKDKSAVVFTENPLAWGSGSVASTFYNNDFKTVTEGIANGTYTMSEFGTTGSSSVTGTVTPNEPDDLKANTPEEKSTGITLGYCMENAVLAGKQNALTSTSIIFEAQIYDKDGKIVDYMIEYDGSFYRNFLALQEATETTEGDITSSPFWGWADEDYPTTEDGRKEWATALAVKNATLYHDGKCYYFSSQIEHFDNDTESADGGKGVMENAIMRNNIYSLAVTGVNGFGFSSINLGSGVLEGEESGTEQEKVYLTMKAKILPWIVRFNDIEF